SLTLAFPLGSGSSLNYTITGTGDCGSPVVINGTLNKCTELGVGIYDAGCSTTGCADYLFMVDNSGSTNNTEFNNMKSTISKTVYEIANSGVDWRIAIVQYRSTGPGNGQITITENFTTNVTALTTFSRAYPTGADYLNEILGELDDALGVTLNPRAGCAKHIVFFSDAVDTDDIQSRIT